MSSRRLCVGRLSTFQEGATPHMCTRTHDIRIRSERKGNPGAGGLVATGGNEHSKSYAGTGDADLNDGVNRFDLEPATSPTDKMPSAGRERGIVPRTGCARLFKIEQTGDSNWSKYGLDPPWWLTRSERFFLLRWAGCPPRCSRTKIAANDQPTARQQLLRERYGCRIGTGLDLEKVLVSIKQFSLGACVLGVAS
jgi:hypothetical protein